MGNTLSNEGTNESINVLEALPWHSVQGMGLFAIIGPDVLAYIVVELIGLPDLARLTRANKAAKAFCEQDRLWTRIFAQRWNLSFITQSMRWKQVRKRAVELTHTESSDVPWEGVAESQVRDAKYWYCKRYLFQEIMHNSLELMGMRLQGYVVDTSDIKQPRLRLRWMMGGNELLTERLAMVHLGEVPPPVQSWHGFRILHNVQPPEPPAARRHTASLTQCNSLCLFTRLD